MTISSTTRKAGPFIGNGSASSFPFTFKVFQASDLLVVQLDTTFDVESTLVLNTNYTVSLNANQNTNPGGTVTLSAGALAAGYTLTITSDIDNLQPTDLTNQGGFYPTVINDALDRATIQIQQLQVESDRSIKVPVSSTVGTNLPTPQANDLLGWNGDASALVNVDPGTLATVAAYATAYADTFTADGSTVNWTLTRDPATINNLDVSIDGVTQVPNVDYTLSGTTFSTTSTVSAGRVILVKYREGLPNMSGDSQDFRYLPAGTGAVATTVQAKLRESVSVKDFGAVGDGVTDDTAAIQAAIDSGALSVKFPSGTYMVDGNIELPLHVNLIGDGYRVSTIESSSGVASITISGGVLVDGTSDHTIQDLSLNNVIIRLFNYVAWFRAISCSFVGSGQTYQGIESFNAVSGDDTRTDNVEIRDCRFYGLYFGIALYHPYNEVTINGNYFSTIAKVAIRMGTLDGTELQNHAHIYDNTIINIGAGALATYVAGILVDGDNIEIHDNYLNNIANSSYWEVDGIYTKAKKGHISNNILVNAGYRTAIQNKQLGLNGPITTTSMQITGNQIYYDVSGTGYSGSLSGVFNGISNVYGGINIVSDNTVVSDNLIVGAGYPIYNANSQAAWLYNNISIINNTILRPRGSTGIFLTGAGERWTVEGNTIKDPDKTLSGHNATFAGISVLINNSWYVTDAGTYWVAGETQYIDRKITKLNVTNNDIDVSMSSASGIYGLDFESRDSWNGGAMPTYPGSFDRLIVTNNTVAAVNSGAGTGYAFLAREEAARFVDCYFDTKSTEYKTAPAVPASSNYGAEGYRTASASPVGVLTPFWVGDLVLVTGGTWYKSTGLTSADWVALN